MGRDRKQTDFLTMERSSEKSSRFVPNSIVGGCGEAGSRVEMNAEERRP